MSDKTIGAIEWRDLTVGDAEGVRDFYQEVVGWKTSPVSMGDYDDYNVNLPESGDTIAGICHASGPNKDIPPVWLMYVRVADIKQSVRHPLSLGGKVLSGPSSFGDDDMFVIQDPAGAVLGLVGLRT